jgi:cytochrome c biogenesis protein ResB
VTAPRRSNRVVSWLGSAKLAVGLMVYLGVVSFIGTAVPQGRASEASVASWAAANPLWESVARAVNLHSMFSQWYFVIPAAVLAVSTAVCSWRRTKVARKRFGLLRNAASVDGSPGRADYSIPLAGETGKDAEAALERAREALAEIGIRGTVREDRVLAATSPWAVWGSAAFHWALVVLFLTLAASALFRSDGLMGVIEGQGVKDAPSAYGVLTTGPLHSWATVDRTIFVNKFYLKYVVDGLDRSASPDVSVLDGRGALVARQVVYPNNLLHTGTLTIHNSAWGLGPEFTLLDSAGSVVGTASVLLDFPAKPTGTTEPGEISLERSDGTSLTLRVSVPLDRRPGRPVQARPETPTVQVEILGADGKPSGGGTIGVGQKVALPDGASLRLDAVPYYARLAVIDDPAIPLLYASLVAAFVGMTFALLARQRLIVVAFADGGEGSRLDVFVRLWSDPGRSSQDVKTALLGTLGLEEEEAEPSGEDDNGSSGEGDSEPSDGDEDEPSGEGEAGS